MTMSHNFLLVLLKEAYIYVLSAYDTRYTEEMQKKVVYTLIYLLVDTIWLKCFRVQIYIL